MLYEVGDSLTSDQAMRFAIEVAKRGLGFVSPNPQVGCVIVDRDHKLLAAEAHLKFGEGHAEVNALNKVKDKKQLTGATLYVTLEPCAHEGKTGSCAKAVAQTTISKVVYGCFDPNPLVAGKGLKILEEAGKVVEQAKKYEKACYEVDESFFYHMKNKKPFMVMKVGASFDGKIALKTGESQWITGEESRIYSRSLRAHYDATMIGAGTLNYDNPTLDFRETAFAGKKENKIIILDPKGKGAENFKETNVCNTHGAKNIFVLTRAEHINQWSKHLVHVVHWEASPAGWQRALENLYQKGIASIFVEGGSYVFGQILQYHLVQKLYLFQSSKIIGEGVSWSQYFQNQTLSQVPQLKNWNSLVLGEDRLNIASF